MENIENQNPFSIVPDNYNINNIDNNIGSINTNFEANVIDNQSAIGELKPKYSKSRYGNFSLPSAFSHLRVYGVSNNTPPSSSIKPFTATSKEEHYSLGGVDTSRLTQKDVDSYNEYVNGRVNPKLELNEIAAHKQSNWEVWGRGLGKFGISVGQSFVEPFVDLLYGVPAMAVKADKELFYDNAVTKWMDGFAKEFNENNPVFYKKSQTEADAMSAENLWSGAFWADQALGSFGYTVGTVLNALVGGALINTATKGAQLGKAANVYSKFMRAYAAEQEGVAGIQAVSLANKAKSFDTIVQGMNAARVKTAIARSGLSLFSAFGESGMEARQNYDTLKPKLDALVKSGEITQADADEALTSANNTRFLLNALTVGASQYVQFGKLFTKGITTEAASLNKIALDTATKKFHSPKSYSWLYDLGTRAVTEGNEEMLQYVYQKIADDNFISKRNGKTFVRKGLGASIEAVANGFSPALSKAWNDKEGQTSIFLGAIMGMLGGAPTIASDQISKNKATELAVNTMNDLINNKDNNFYKHLVHIGKQYAIQEALESTDSKFDKKNLEDQSLIELVGNLQRTGSFETFTDYIDDVMSMNVDEYMKLNTGTTNGHILNKNKDEIIQGILQKSNEYKNIYDKINGNFSDRTPQHRDVLYRLAASAHGLSNRRTDILNSLELNAGIKYEDVYKETFKEYESKIRTAYRNSLPEGQTSDLAKENEHVRNTISEEEIAKSTHGKILKQVSDNMNKGFNIENGKSIDEIVDEIKDLAKIDNSYARLSDVFRYVNSKEGFEMSNKDAIKSTIKDASKDINNKYKKQSADITKAYDSAFKKTANVESIDAAIKQTEDFINTLSEDKDNIDPDDPKKAAYESIYDNFLKDANIRLTNLNIHKEKKSKEVENTEGNVTKQENKKRKLGIDRFKGSVLKDSKESKTETVEDITEDTDTETQKQETQNNKKSSTKSKTKPVKEEEQNTKAAIDFIKKEIDANPEDTIRALWAKAYNDDATNTVYEIDDTITATAEEYKSLDSAITSISSSQAFELLYNNSNKDAALYKYISGKNRSFENINDVLKSIEELVNDGNTLSKESFSKYFMPYYNYLYINFEKEVASDLLDNVLKYSEYVDGVNQNTYNEELSNTKIEEVRQKATERINTKNIEERPFQKTPSRMATSRQTNSTNTSITKQGAIMLDSDKLAAPEKIGTKGSEIKLNIDNSKPNFTITVGKETILSNTDEVLNKIKSAIASNDFSNISREEIANIPIALFNTDDKQFAYIHNSDWFNKNRNRLNPDLTNADITNLENDVIKYKLMTIINLIKNNRPLVTTVEYANNGYVSNNTEGNDRYTYVKNAIRSKHIYGVAKDTGNGVEIFTSDGTKFPHRLSNNMVDVDGNPTMISGITYLLSQTNSVLDEYGNAQPVYTAYALKSLTFAENMADNLGYRLAATLSKALTIGVKHKAKIELSEIETAFVQEFKRNEVDILDSHQLRNLVSQLTFTRGNVKSLYSYIKDRYMNPNLPQGKSIKNGMPLVRITDNEIEMAITNANYFDIVTIKLYDNEFKYYTKRYLVSQLGTKQEGKPEFKKYNSKNADELESQMLNTLLNCYMKTDSGKLNDSGNYTIPVAKLDSDNNITGIDTISYKNYNEYLDNILMSDFHDVKDENGDYHINAGRAIIFSEDEMVKNFNNFNKNIDINKIISELKRTENGDLIKVTRYGGLFSFDNCITVTDNKPDLLFDEDIISTSTAKGKAINDSIKAIGIIHKNVTNGDNYELIDVRDNILEYKKDNKQLIIDLNLLDRIDKNFEKDITDAILDAKSILLTKDSYSIIMYNKNSIHSVILEEPVPSKSKVDSPVDKKVETKEVLVDEVKEPTNIDKKALSAIEKLKNRVRNMDLDGTAKELGDDENVEDDTFDSDTINTIFTMSVKYGIMDNTMEDVIFDTIKEANKIKDKILDELDSSKYSVIVNTQSAGTELKYTVEILSKVGNSKLVIDDRIYGIIQNTLNDRGILVGIRSNTQNDVITWLTNKAYQKLIDNPDNKYTIEELVSEYKDVLKNIIDEHDELANDILSMVEETKSEILSKYPLLKYKTSELNNMIEANISVYGITMNDVNKYVSISHEMKRIYDNYEDIVKRVETELCSWNVLDKSKVSNSLYLKGNLSEDNDDDTDTIEADEKEYTKEDTTHYSNLVNLSISHKKTASIEIKKFFSNIQKFRNNNGTLTPVNNIFGEPSYMSYNDVIEDLFALLSDTPRTFEQMMGVIKENIATKPYLKDVHSKLNMEYENTQSKIPMMFTKLMNKHSVEMEAIMIKALNQGGVSTNIIDVNKSSVVKTIMSTWQNNFMNGRFAISSKDDNAVYINTDSFKKFIEDSTKSEIINMFGDKIRDDDKYIAVNLFRFFRSNDSRLFELFNIPTDIDFKELMSDYTSNVTKQVIVKRLIESGIDNNVLDKVIKTITTPEMYSVVKNHYLRSVLNDMGIDVSIETVTEHISKGNPVNKILSNLKTNIVDKFIETNSNIDVSTVNVFAPIYNFVRDYAKIEQRYAIVQKESSFRDQSGRMMQTFSQFKYMFERLNKIRKDTEYRKQLVNTAMNSVNPFMQSIDSILGDSENSLEIKYADSFINKLMSNTTTKPLSEDNTSVMELYKMFAFLNSGNATMGKFLYPTLSDGNIISSLNYNRKIYSLSNIKGKLFKDDLITDYFNRCIYPELNRIEQFIKANPNINAKGYKDGAMHVILTPVVDKYINRLTDGESLLDGFKNGTRNFIIDKNNIPSDLKEILMNDILAEATRTAEMFANLGILHSEPLLEKTEETEATVINKGDIVHNGQVYRLSTKNDVGGKFAYIDKNSIDLLKANGANNALGLMVNYVVNYRLAHSNTIALFIGDPASYWNRTIQGTNENISKRLAGDRGPGELTADYADKKAIYNQFFIKDSKSVSVANEFIKSVNSKFDYSDIDASDGQELTSLYEDLKVRVQMGTMSRALFDKLYGTNGIIYNYLKDNIIIGKTVKLIDETLNYEDVVLKGLKSDKALYAEYINLVNQPVKPVYVNNEILSDNKFSADSRMYVKSSSYALRPNITGDFQIDELRKACDISTYKYLSYLYDKGLTEESASVNDIKNATIKSNRIDRIAFDSAVKVGLPSSSIPNIFEGDLDYNGILSIMSDNKKLFTRAGFRVQQELPYKDEKDAIKRGTQESKLLFNNLLEVAGLSELKEKYDKLYSDIYNNNAKNLIDKIVTNGKLNYTNINELLINEAKSRNFTDNDISAFELNDTKTGFKRPLLFHSKNVAIEGLLNSIVNNTVLKIKIPGRSYVLASETGYKKRVKTSVSAKDKSNIIFTSKFDGQLKSHGFRSKETNEYVSIDYASNNPDKVYYQPDQVILPSYFRINGKLIDLEAKDKSGNYIYINNVDGKLMIKEDMFDSETLRLFGFRIPTQGHSSMASIEVVGFTRKNAGEFIVAPRDFVKRMGSDFDIDKLYTYNYNIDFVNNKFIKDSEYSKQIINDIIDIHHKVFSSTDRKVQELILSPLSYGIFKNEDTKFRSHSEEVNDKIDANNNPDIADYIDSLYSSSNTLGFLSNEYQHDFYRKGKAGKMGIAVFSVNSVFNSIVQSKGIKYGYTDKDGTFHPKTVIIGNSEISGDSFDNPIGVNGILKSVVISWYQSISVDNAKLNKMTKVNINNNTFNVINFLNQMGFDEEVVWLINQPIVRKYLQTKENEEANIRNTFVNDMDILKKIRNEFGYETFKEKFANTSPRAISQYGDSSFTIENMHDAILKYGTLTTDKTKVSEEDIEDFNFRQLAILDAFIQYDELGGKMSEIQQAINIDSKSIGSNFTNVISKLQKQDDVINIISKTFKNANELIVAEKDDITSSAIKNSMYIISEILGSEFPQFTSNFKDAYLNILLNSGKNFTDYSVKEIINDLMDTIRTLGNIYSIENLVGDDYENISPITSIRYKLLGENYLRRNKSKDETINKSNFTNDVANTKNSLASILSYIQSTPFGKTNRFINSLVPKISKSNSKFSTVTYNSTKDDSHTDHAIYSDLLKILNDNPVFNINGQLYNGRQFVADIIAYSKLNGGMQRFNDFAKFIPVEIENAIGITKNLSDFKDNIPELLNGFTTKEVYRQFIQHNPKWAHNVSLNVKTKNDETANLFTLRDADGVALKGDDNNLSKAKQVGIKLKYVSPVTKKVLVYEDNGNPVCPYSFISHKTKSGEYMLFEQVGYDSANKEFKFNLINTLGNDSVVEYDTTAINYPKDSIDMYKGIRYKDGKQVVMEAIDGVLPDDKLSNVDRAFGYKNRSIKLAMMNIANSDSNKLVSYFARHFLRVLNTQSINEMPIIISKDQLDDKFLSDDEYLKEFIKASGYPMLYKQTMYNGVSIKYIVFDENWANKQSFETLSKEIVHEVGHAMLKDTMDKGMEKLIAKDIIEVSDIDKVGKTINEISNSIQKNRNIRINRSAINTSKLSTEEAFALTMLDSLEDARKALDRAEGFDFNTEGLMQGYYVDHALTTQQKALQGLVNPQEFIAELVSNQEFIKFLDEVESTSPVYATRIHKVSILNNILTIMKRVLNKLFGFEFKDNSVATNAMSSIMLTLEKNSNTGLVKNFDTSIPTTVNDKFVEKTQDELDAEFDNMVNDNLKVLGVNNVEQTNKPKTNIKDMTDADIDNMLFNDANSMFDLGTARLLNSLDIEQTVNRLIEENKLTISCKL